MLPPLICKWNNLLAGNDDMDAVASAGVLVSETAEAVAMVLEKVPRVTLDDAKGVLSVPLAKAHSDQGHGQVQVAPLLFPQPKKSRGAGTGKVRGSLNLHLVPASPEHAPAVSACAT